MATGVEPREVYWTQAKCCIHFVLKILRVDKNDVICICLRENE